MENSNHAHHKQKQQEMLIVKSTKHNNPKLSSCCGNPFALFSVNLRLLRSARYGENALAGIRRFTVSAVAAAEYLSCHCYSEGKPANNKQENCNVCSVQRLPPNEILALSGHARMQLVLSMQAVLKLSVQPESS